MRVADVLARALAEAGVTYAFGIPGGEVLCVIDALGRAGIEFITARHETAAGLIAQGVAAVGGGAPAVLVATVGPGVANGVNAVANAYLDRVPMIVLTGAVAPPARGGYTHQIFDQVALLRPVVKASFVVDASSVEAMIAQALAVASAHPRGPVHVEVPMHVAAELASCEVANLPPSAAEVRDRHAVIACAAENVDDSPPLRVRQRPGDLGAARAAISTSAERPPCARADAIAAVAECLAGAERPLVLAGLEAVDAPVAAALEALLQRWPAPLLTTYKAKGVVDEHRENVIGAIALSPKADAQVAGLFEAADVVLLVGYDPVEMRAAYNQPFAAHTHVIEVAHAPREHGMHTSHSQVLGDLTVSLTGLRERMPRSHQPLWPDTRPSQVRRSLRAAFTAGDDAGFSPLMAADVVARVLPEDAHLTIDTGAHRIVLSQLLRARWPGQLSQSNGLCTMGYALPAAIGLALQSGRRVIAAMGDGGFEMVLGELATLRDLGLPVTIVVFDDSSLALIDVKQHAAGFARSGVWLGATDHVAIARAFGGRGTRVHDAPSFEAALRTALGEREGFSVISCALERGAYADLL